MLGLQNIEAAKARLADNVYRSPCPRSMTLGELCGCEIRVKLENLQMTGSFKERGSLNKLCVLEETQRQRGVIAASAASRNSARRGMGNAVGTPVKGPSLETTLVVLQGSRKGPL